MQEISSGSEDSTTFERRAFLEGERSFEKRAASAVVCPRRSSNYLTARTKVYPPVAAHKSIIFSESFTGKQRAATMLAGSKK